MTLKKIFVFLQTLPSWRNACTCCYKNRINCSVKRLSPHCRLSVCANAWSYSSVTSSPSPDTVQSRRLWRGKRKREIPPPSRVEGESCPEEYHNRDWCENWALAPDCFDQKPLWGVSWLSVFAHQIQVPGVKSLRCGFKSWSLVIFSEIIHNNCFSSPRGTNEYLQE